MLWHANPTAKSFTGSTSALGSVSKAAQSIIDQMNVNSLLWYTDPANRKNYEQQNVVLSKQLQALVEPDENGGLTSYSPVYNEKAGTWTVTPQYQSAQQQIALKQSL